MGWRERLRTASWKGVRFYVLEHELASDRRVVSHEFPYRATSYVEDLGRSPQGYTINGYLLGDDYMSARDSLLEAVESGGSGALIHPWLGTRQVLCEKCRIKETRRDGGYVALTLIFVEAGENIYPAEGPHAKKRVELAGSTLKASAKAEFTEKLVTSAVQECVREQIAETLSQLGGLIRSALPSTVRATDLAHSASIELAAWAATVDEIVNFPLTLINDVEGMADSVVASVEGIRVYAQSLEGSLRTLTDISTFTAPTGIGDAAAAKQITANAAVIDDLVATAIATESAQVAMETTYDSYDEALAARRRVLNLLDDVTGENPSDEIYDSVLSLRVAIADGLPDPTASLPRLVDINIPEPLPALVLSYELYGHVDLESDIVARNKIRHPGFCPAAQKMTVIAT